jgi:dihydrofolate synthase/folylpolyglutamate synthase
MDFPEALASLDARQPERMVPDLTRITELANLLGHPQLTYPTIHVTGTNGKTTTARVITSLACELRLTTGTFTSPHLESVTERLTVCGEDIGEEEFAEEMERLLPYLEMVDARGERVTYFETLTALAYLWFADKPVALGVFEVGMGGLWDATNLVGGDVAVICPIALDHPELGPTIRHVAAEKAGIVKAGKTTVSRQQPEDALEVLEARTREVEARLLLEGRDWELAGRVQGIGAQLLRVRGLHGEYDELRLPLFGEHSARNAAAAVVSLEAFLDRELEQEAVQEAFAAVTSPGRLEVLSRRPLVVLDGAHNPAGADALVRALPQAFVWERLHLVLGVSANKDIDGIVRTLAPLADQTYACRNSSPRSAPAERVLEACRAAGLEAGACGSVQEALEAARSAAGEADLILVTGSLYTVADARRSLVSREP